MDDLYRIGDAAKALGVRVETLRRWEKEGKVAVTRSAGGQRQIAAAEVARLLLEQRKQQAPIASESVRNHFRGIITEVKRDKVMATVEIQAGPFRILSAVTREAVDEMQLKPGMEAIAAMKATNVTIELPHRKGNA